MRSSGPSRPRPGPGTPRAGPTGNSAPHAKSSDREISELLHRARLSAFLGLPPDAGGSAHSENTELSPLLRQTAAVYAQAVSPTTRSDYARRWRHFEAWCEEHKVRSLPASPETTMSFLMQRAGGSQASSLATLRGWLAAINRIHLEAGFSPPGDDPGMAMFLRGLRRLAPQDVPQEPIKALRIADLREICRGMQAGVADPALVRDRLILLLSARGLSAAQMAHLRWENLTLGRTRIRHASVTSPEVIRADAASSSSWTSQSLVQAMTDWHAIAGAIRGPCLIRIDAQGRARQGALRPSEVERILATRIRCLGGDRDLSAGEASRLLVGAPSLNLRDRAILLLGFAGAFRRSELTGLRWSDVRSPAEGLVIRLRRSKTDLSGRGRSIGIPYGRSTLTCPVRAMHAWHDRVRLHLGRLYDDEMPCFVTVGRAGGLGRDPLTPETVARLVRRRAAAVGLSGRWGGRSLRAGFISTAADLDIPLEQIARQSRHATLDTLLTYIRQEDLFHSNAADRLGL